MKKSIFALLVVLSLVAASTLSFAGVNNGFQQGIMIELDGEAYTLAGVPLGDGTNEVPGHYWVISGKNRLTGKHYNSSSPLANEFKFWSSDAPLGELLYNVKGIIDTRSEENDMRYKALGYVHIHELVTVAEGTEHPNKVLYLKHTARTSFKRTHPNPELYDEVTPGIDYDFVNNY